MGCRETSVEKYIELSKYLKEINIQLKGITQTVSIASILKDIENIKEKPFEFFEFLCNFCLNISSIMSITELSDIVFVEPHQICEILYTVDKEKGKKQNFHYNILLAILKKNKAVNKLNIRSNMAVSPNSKANEFVYKLLADEEELKTISDNIQPTSKVEIILPKFED